KRALLLEGGLAGANLLSAYETRVIAETEIEQSTTVGTIPVSLRVNGQVHLLNLEPHVTLLDALRQRIGLTGSKKGCNPGAIRRLHGACGWSQNESMPGACGC